MDGRQSKLKNGQCFSVDMLLCFPDDSLPKAVFPSHAERHTKTFTALCTSFNTKAFCLSVKCSAGKAFHNTKTTVKTVYHSLIIIHAIAIFIMERHLVSI